MLMLMVEPTRRCAISVGHDGQARLWDWLSGEPVSPPLRHGAPVHAAALSPAGDVLALAGSDGCVRLWRLPDPELAPLSTLVRRAERLAFRRIVDGQLWGSTSTADSPRGPVVWQVDPEVRGVGRPHEPLRRHRKNRRSVQRPLSAPR